MDECSCKNMQCYIGEGEVWCARPAICHRGDTRETRIREKKRCYVSLLLSFRHSVVYQDMSSFLIRTYWSGPLHIWNKRWGNSEPNLHVFKMLMYATIIIYRFYCKGKHFTNRLIPQSFLKMHLIRMHFKGSARWRALRLAACCCRTEGKQQKMFHFRLSVQP